MTEAISTATFREALAHFATGVTIVAVQSPAGPVGFTATGFTSRLARSAAPFSFRIHSTSTRARMMPVVAADHFGVSILHEEQAGTALQFARSGVDRFEGVDLRAPRGVAPLIGGALAHLECRKHARHIEGDHTILVGEVLSARVGPGRPLLHFARRFGHFAERG